MHERGVRGIRCNLINPGGLLRPPSPLGNQRFARWAGTSSSRFRSTSSRAGPTFSVPFDTPVVIDHMGRPTPGLADPLSPALAQLISLVRDGRCFVKLSAPYRLHPPSRCALWRASLALGRCDAARARVPRGQRVGLFVGYRLAARRYCARGEQSDVITALDDWRGDRWTGGRSRATPLNGYSRDDARA